MEKKVMDHNETRDVTIEIAVDGENCGKCRFLLTDVAASNYCYLFREFKQNDKRLEECFQAEEWARCS
jgi:hypothetical protein